VNLETDMSEADEERPRPGWARATGHTTIEPMHAGVGAGEAIDRLLIAERVARYGWAYDERDRDGLADCFTGAGVWEGKIMGIDQVGPFQGRGAIIDFLAGFWGEQTDQRRHVFTNVVVEKTEPDVATAHAYLILLGSADASMTPLTAGPYRFEFVRDTDGVWRIARLLAGFDAPY
jgi:SnoaL-like domain